MIHPETSEEWLTYAEAARAVRVREDLIRQWVRRRKVERHTIGRRVYVHMGDVRTMEAKWARRVSR